MSTSSLRVTTWRLNLARGLPAVIACATCLGLARDAQAQIAGRASSPEPLSQLSRSTEALVQQVSQSVVQVQTTGYGAVEEADGNEAGLIGRQRSIGAGVIVDSDGYIVTNAHVVTGAERVQIVLPAPAVDESPVRSVVGAGGRIVDAHIVGVAREIDVAVLKVDMTRLPAIRIGNYDLLRQGQLVFAFGSPGGLRNSVSMGVVSAVARQPDPDSPMIYVQTDAAINPGNSGGPLVNVEGELVGINTFILSESGGNEGLGFAIPSAIVSVAYEKIRKVGHLHRGEIGAELQTVTPNMAAGLGLARSWGVIVSDLQPGGPAARAGMQVQDLIATVGDKPIESLPVLLFELYTHSAGDVVKIGVLRGNKELALYVPVIEPKGAESLADLVDATKGIVEKLGIVGVDIDSKVAALLPDVRIATGVIVGARAEVWRGSTVPLTPGDIIHAINGTVVWSLTALRAALDSLKPGSSVALQIERDGRLMFVAFQLE
jgi:serine protease Do